MVLSSLLLIGIAVRYASTCMTNGAVDPETFLAITDRMAYNPRRLGPVTTSDTVLNCGFDHDNEFCHWQQGQGQILWALAKFNRAISSRDFQTYTGELDQPDMYFLYAGTERGVAAFEYAELYTDIPCQTNEGQLEFDAWATSERIKMEVCVVPQRGAPQCEVVDPRGPNPVRVRIPPNSDPFIIRIRASGFTQPDVVMVDNIRYNADICPNIVVVLCNCDHGTNVDISVRDLTTRLGTQVTVESPINVHVIHKVRLVGTAELPPSYEPPLLSGNTTNVSSSTQRDNSPKYIYTVHDKKTVTDRCNKDGGNFDPQPGRLVNDCTLLECDMNTGTVCQYDTRGMGSRNGIWNAGGGVIGNRNTGIRSDNPQDTGTSKGYAFVGRNANLPGEPIYVLESPQFVVKRLGDINFDYYLRSATTRLQLCVDDITSCIWTANDLRDDPKREWASARVPLPADGQRHKLLFVVPDLQDFSYAAVDNIQLTGVERTDCQVLTR